MKKTEGFRKQLGHYGKKIWPALLVLLLIIPVLLLIWFLGSYVGTLICAKQYLTVLKEFFTIVALVIGVFIGVLVSRKLVPVLYLQIQPEWVGEQKKFLKLTFEVTNKSGVILNKPKKENMFSVQFLPYNISDSDMVNDNYYCLTEWVPFEYNKDEGDPENRLSVDKYRPPKRVFTTTEKIEPGETIHGERLYYPPAEAMVFKVGLQARGTMHIFISMIMLCLGIKPNDRWTTTRIVVRPGTEGNAQQEKTKTDS